MASAVIFPLDLSFQDGDRFSGTLRSWDLGSASLIHLQTDAARYVRRNHHVSADSGDHVLVSFSSHSDVGFSQDGVDLLCRKRQFFIEKTHQASDFVQSDFNEVWVLKLPITSLKRYTRSIDPFYSSLFDGDTGVGGLLFDMVRQIPHRYGATNSLAAEGVGQTLMELLVLAVEADERALTSGRSSVQRGHVARIEKFVRQHLGDPDLSPEKIARACNISVRYLHALFQGSGSSVAQWIREMRLESCRTQLCEPHRRESLGEIAYRWGFGDQAQFSRLFKAQFGMTPRDMRAEARKAAEAG
ncbi:helix-turn-helix domain-containing protein [Hansschlegelia quercus]|uniref:Helix-turn-helix domain-containing protein n=1 Tax=Hansschlegelia quercus TaxID=2528245 RepID=A0A4Q9GHQ6_9HYPH|nr:helix-turn-helix domain-containing protein [Hansschlegelia quercus]TBN53592.1 helix-turn-helix domain-containing protein [Hansschlegelia quercus]